MTNYILHSGGKSIISRIYGLYIVEYPVISPVYLMLQRNNIQLGIDNKLLSVFDLKGSKFNRRVVSEETIVQNAHNSYMSYGARNTSEINKDVWINKNRIETDISGNNSFLGGN